MKKREEGREKRDERRGTREDNKVRREKKVRIKVNNN
jgi:hypothetical protein